MESRAGAVQDAGSATGSKQLTSIPSASTPTRPALLGISEIIVGH
jgi:hypothetical protein